MPPADHQQLAQMSAPLQPVGTVISSQVAVAGATNAEDDDSANPRPKKKYETSVYAVDPTYRPDMRCKTPNVITACDYGWLVGIVTAHDEATARGNKVQALTTKCKGRLDYLQPNVLKSHFKEIRRRCKMKKKMPVKVHATESDILKHELHARKQELAKTQAAFAEAQTKAAERDRLEGELQSRNEKLAKTKQELAEAQAEVAAATTQAQEDAAAHALELSEAQAALAETQAKAASDSDAQVATLTAKIEEQSRAAERQRAAIAKQDEDIQRLRAQIFSDPTVNEDLQIKLDKAETCNVQLSKSFSATSKAKKQLMEQLAAVKKENLQRQRDYEAKTQELGMQLRRWQEDHHELSSGLDVFNQCLLVEHELRTLLMAVRCQQQQSVFDKQSPYWNNVTMTELALSVMEALGSDNAQVKRRKKQLDEWREARSDICHNPGALTNYQSKARELVELTGELREQLSTATKGIHDCLLDEAFARLVNATTQKTKKALRNHPRK